MMDTTQKHTAPQQAFVDSIASRTQPLEPMNRLGKEAREALTSLSFPSRKTEAWKYTPVNSLLKLSMPETTATSGIPTNITLPQTDGYLWVTVNGQPVAEASSLPENTNVFIGLLSEAHDRFPDLVNAHLGTIAEQKHDIFTALNGSAAADGLAVILPVSETMDKPLRIIHITTDGAWDFPRLLVIAGKNSEASVEVRFMGDDKSTFTNAVTEVFVEEDARVNVSFVEENNGNTIQQTWVSQQSKSNCGVHTLTVNGRLVRNNLTMLLNGEHCESALNGLYITRDDMHVDNHTLVDHRQPNCMSDEMYKGILGGKSTGVFNGKVYVRPHAQKTNAFQSNRNILLSEDARVNSKPELEIYADDVKCSHGSTTGRLDNEALFYLRSRGLSTSSATKLLLQAFGEEVLERIPDHDLNELARNHLQKI